MVNTYGYSEGMGRLRYGREVDVELDDRMLAHLDGLLADMGDANFQIHLRLDDAASGDVVSLRVGDGVPLVIEFADEDHEVDSELLERAHFAVADRGVLEFPEAFVREGE